MTPKRLALFSAILLASGLALSGSALAGAQNQHTTPSDGKSCTDACSDSCASQTEESQDREEYTKCMKECIKKCKEDSKLLLVTPGG